MDFETDVGSAAGKIGIGGCFTLVRVQSASVAQGAELFGEELAFLPEFYDCSAAEIKDGMLRGPGDVIRLVGRDARGIRTERFTWKTVQADGRADLYRGDEKLCAVEVLRDEVTVYCREDDERVYLLTDGRIADEGDAEVRTISGISVLSAEKERREPLVLEAKGLALEDYMRLKG